MKIYHWDFFGPACKRTAEHFLIHLNAFLQEHAIEGCATGVSSEGRGHMGAWCQASDEVSGPIVEILKPKRATLPHPPDETPP